jgi:hypothetical protein
MEVAPAEEQGEAGDRVFSLRCRACEREMPYRASEIIEIAGTPRPRGSRRAHDHAKLLRQQNKMAQAANG